MAQRKVLPIDKEPTQTLAQETAEIIARSVTIGPAIAVGASLLDFAVTAAQLGFKSVFPKNMAPFLKSVGAGAGAGSLKGFFILYGKELDKVLQEQYEGLSKKNRLAAPFVTATLDGFFLTPIINQKISQSSKAGSDIYKGFSVTLRKEKIGFNWAGTPLRTGSSFGTISLYLLSDNYLQHQLKALFPPDTFGTTNQIVAPLVSGMTSSIFTMPFDYLHKQKISTFMLTKQWPTIGDIITTHGFTALWKGIGPQMAKTGLIFLGFTKFNAYFDENYSQAFHSTKVSAAPHAVMFKSPVVKEYEPARDELEERFNLFSAP